ncbi:hypothetical protein BJ322DRAFT_197880 [Thelephora terrestris]|uniref:Uncharacterized protein n=1 Tax=Thelephora terrestris TaxID=56493 RepID=A0A9P6H9D2_9AGAM|nr:hypothetical protein BJ322DRAFT_197880 [Thelephora terrestris]
MAGRLASSVLIGFVLESLLYGAFIMIFIAAAITQRERWRQEKLGTANKLTMGFSILLLGFISTHWILNFWRCYDVFLSGSDLPTIDDAFGNQRNGTNLARFIVYEVQAWMGDCLLIYRLYFVCNRKWTIVAVPCTMCVALVACGLYLLKTTLKLDFLDPESTKPFHTWAIVCFTLTFGENLYCLVAIAFFIWRAQHKTPRHPTIYPLTAVLWIFIESAGMWLLFVGLTFFVYQRSRAPFAYVAGSLDANPRQSKEIAFSPAGLYIPRPSHIPTVSPSNGLEATDPFLSVSLL